MNRTGRRQDMALATVTLFVVKTRYSIPTAAPAMSAEASATGEDRLFPRAGPAHALHFNSSCHSLLGHGTRGWRECLRIRPTSTAFRRGQRSGANSRICQMLPRYCVRCASSRCRQRKADRINGKFCIAPCLSLNYSYDSLLGDWNMIITRNFWFILSFCVVNMGGGSMSCYGSDIFHASSASSSVAKPSLAQDILADHGIDLGDFQNPTQGLPDGYFKLLMKELSEPMTAERESQLGYLYHAGSSSPTMPYKVRAPLMLEALRHYLKAAELGDDSSVFCLFLALNELTDAGDEEQMTILGGEENLRKAVFAILKLAADSGDVQAQEEYKYTMQHPSPPTSQASLTSSRDPSLVPAGSFDAPLHN